MNCLFFKQKTAYEMRISDWSSDVCSSDLMRSAEVWFQPGATTPATCLVLGSGTASFPAQEGAECLGVRVADSQGDLGGVEVGGCRKVPSPFDAKTVDEAKRSEERKSAL